METSVRPIVKYTLSRLAVFAIVLVILLPVPVDFLLKTVIALLASAVVSYFLLAKLRDEMALALVGRWYSTRRR